MAPDTSVSALPANQSAVSFVVSWTGEDPSPGSEIESYDVQYRVKDEGGWVDWLSETSLTSHSFGPFEPLYLQDGQTYFFRCRARDGAGNLEGYPGWTGDTRTVVSMLRLVLPVVVK